MFTRVSPFACVLVALGLATLAARGEEKETKKTTFLRQRIEVSEVQVPVSIDAGRGEDNPSSFWNGRPLRPVIYALQPDGGAQIGWTDAKGTIHITPLDKYHRRRGEDTIITSGLLRDLVAHDDASAAIVYQNGGMYLIRSEQGKTVFRKRLISNWCRNIHLGSLAWNGERYAAYFGVHRGGHEGDALKFVDKSGKALSGGWSWGCSHSIDMRVIALGKQFMPLALSDAYPGTGIWFNHNKKRVAYTWGDWAGATGARIGGFVALNGKMYVAYSSKQGGRSHWSAALADFAQKSPYKQTVKKYVHDAKVDQLNIKLARYGSDQLLMSWRDKGSQTRRFQRFDAEAKPVGGPEQLPVLASPRDDLKTDPNGNVLWAYSTKEKPQTLHIARLRYSAAATSE